MKNSYKKNLLLFAFFAAFGFIIAACTSTGSGTGSVGGAAGGYDAGVLVSTLAGDGTKEFADGRGTSAKFNDPHGVAVDKAGNVYVADMLNHRIRKIDSRGNVTTLAGSGTNGFADGRGTAAKFNWPTCIALDRVGNFYVADMNNHRIRKITPGGDVSTLAGDGTIGFADGRGTAAKFNYPTGIAIDGAGNLYVADTYNHRIRKITPAGNVTTLAGSGTNGFADGSGVTAKFAMPTGVAVDRAGIVYAADFDNHRIRRIDSMGNVSTLAGDGSKGFADGQGTSAKFYTPNDIAIDGAGNLYVADTSNNRIRKIDSTGQVITLAGDGSRGFADGPGISAKFNWPYGVAADSAGDLYVADRYNGRIRKITLRPPEKSNGDEKSAGVKLGELIGSIGGFDGAEIIVNGKDTIGRQAPMGRALIVDANGEYIFLQSTFPMQTIVKCKVTKGDRSLIKKGMKVYLKP